MRAISYFLGVTLGAPLLFFIISSIFLGPRKVSSPEIFGAAFIGRAFFSSVSSVGWSGAIKEFIFSMPKNLALGYGIVL